MNDNENRRYQMFLRVARFGSAHGADFAANSIGKQLFTNLSTIITELQGHGALEFSGVGAARQGTVTRRQARSALRDELEAINRTARAMADDVPGLDDKFRVPRNNNDLQLLNAARAFATDALPLKAQFIALELSSDFLEDLNGGIEAMQAAISDQSGGLTTRVNSAAAIDDAVGRGIEVVRKLGAIIKNKYGANPAVLAEWTSVSHTERAPRRSAGAAAPPPGGPGPEPPPPPPSAG